MSSPGAISQGILSKNIAANDAAARTVAARDADIDKTLASAPTFNQPPPKLDAQPFQAPPAQDPMKAWGAPTTLLALIASMATRHPLTAALTSATAAINAVKANNASAYQTAFDAWKANTDYAFKRAEWENEQYRNAFDVSKNTFDQMMEKAELTARITNHQVMLAQLRAGNLEGATAVWNASTNAARQANEARQQVLETGEKAQRLLNYNDSIKEYKASHGGQDPSSSERTRMLDEAMAPTGVTTLTPAAVTDAAAYFLKTGKFPAGMRDKAATSAIQNRIAEMRPPGVSAEDWMNGIVNNTVAMHARNAGATTAGKGGAMTAVNEGTVNNSIKILRDLIPIAASRGRFTSVDGLEQMIGRETNDANAINFKNAIDSITAEYARVMTGATTGAPSSDASRKEAEERILLGYNNATLPRVLDQIQAEMRGRSAAYESVLGQLTGGTYAGPTPQNAPAAAGSNFVNGKVYEDGHGNRAKYVNGQWEPVP